MSTILPRDGPTPELVAVAELVQTTGDIAVVFPSVSIGDLEAITAETQRRQLRIAGIPRGGYTLLPAIPMDDDDLLRLCEAYCGCGEADRAVLRGGLYVRPYPLFDHRIGYARPLYHPAEYITRIMQFCAYYVQVPAEELPALRERCPYLHISPVKEICSFLRCQVSHALALGQQEEEKNAPWLLQLHAREDVERVTASAPYTPPPLEPDGAAAASPSGGADDTPAEVELVFQTGAVEDAADQRDDLTGEETVDAVPGANAEYITMAGLSLVNKTSIFYDREGEGQRVVAVYIRGGIASDACAAAAAVLEPAATKNNLRAATNGGVPPDTGIVGFYDYLTNPTPHKCRETEFSRRHWGALADCEPFLRQLDRLYSQMAPMHHHLQKVAIPTQYQLSDTVFSTITVNRNFRTAVHTDKGDFRSGLGVLAVINGDFEGCHLAIKRINKAFELKTGDVLLFDTAFEHGNTEVTSPDGAWHRTSVVCYLRTGLLSSVCELERRRHLNRGIMHQLQAATVRQAVVNINGADSTLPPLFVPTRLAGQLAPVQLSALGFIVERAAKQSGCVVAMTMGLGKTLVALTVCFSRLHLGPQSDILILTPKPIITHWVDERNKWAAYGLHFSHFVAADGLNNLQFEQQLLEYDQQRTQERTRSGHVFVINSEFLGSFLRRFRHFTPSLIIVDEGHRVASKGNKMTEALDRLQCNLRIVLSGTPLQNDASELYRVVGWVNRGVTKVLPPRRFQELASEVNRFILGDDSAFQCAVVALEYIQDWMRGFVFREMATDLPPLHDYLLVCGSSDVQRDYEAQLGLTAGAAVSLNATEHRPHHLSTHPACYLAFATDSYQSMLGSAALRERERGSASRLTTLSEVDAARLGRYTQMVEAEQLDSFIDVSGKMRVLIDIVRRVQARREKLIVFSLYVGSQDLIHRTLTALRVCTFTVRGRDSQDRRRRAMLEFSSNENLIVLVASTKVAAYGLDFTAANHVVLFDSWWNPQVDAQAIARAYRRNQTKPVTVYRLISATENGSVLRLQTRKIALFRSILHERPSRAATGDEIEDCAATETDEERRAFWLRLKATSLSGGFPALVNVYRYQEGVRENL